MPPRTGRPPPRACGSCVETKRHLHTRNYERLPRLMRFENLTVGYKVSGVPRRPIPARDRSRLVPQRCGQIRERNMLKTASIAVGTLLVLSAAGAAWAETACEETHPRRDQVND